MTARCSEPVSAIQGSRMKHRAAQLHNERLYHSFTAIREGIAREQDLFLLLCCAVLCSGLLPLIRTMWRPGIFLVLQLALLLGFACSSTGSEARNAKAQLGASRRQGYRFFDCCFDNFRAASRWGHRFDYIPRQRRNNSRTLSIDYVKPRHVPNGSNCSFIELFSTHLHHLVSILVAIKSRIVTNFYSSWMTHYVPDYIVAITIEVIMNAFQILSAATPLKYKLQLGFTIYWRILTDKIKLKFIL